MKKHLLRSHGRCNEVFYKTAQNIFIFKIIGTLVWHPKLLWIMLQYMHSLNYLPRLCNFLWYWSFIFDTRFLWWLHTCWLDIKVLTKLLLWRWVLVQHATMEQNWNDIKTKWKLKTLNFQKGYSAIVIHVHRLGKPFL